MHFYLHWFLHIILLHTAKAALHCANTELTLQFCEDFLSAFLKPGNSERNKAVLLKLLSLDTQQWNDKECTFCQTSIKA